MEHFIKLIIPCYNVESKIGGMLDSILSQTFTDYHIVCVEDCSTDGTIKVLNQYKEKYGDEKITVIQNETNQGSALSRNNGYEKTLNSVPSQFIWFVDGDDYIAGNDVLQKIYDKHIENPDIELFFIGWTDLTAKKYCVANMEYPIGLWGMVFRSERYVKGIKVGSGDDVYPHHMILDSVEDSKIGCLDYNCYIYPSMGGRCKANRKVSANILAEALMKHEFRKQSVVDSILNNPVLSWIKATVPKFKLIFKRKVSILMASFPYRKKWMLKCIEQLMPQCDNFYLWLNEYDEVPDELNKYDSSKLHITLSDRNMKENGRYTFIMNPEIKDDYCLICDDDINYPKDYVQNTLNCFGRLGGNIVVAYYIGSHNQFNSEYRNDKAFDIGTSYCGVRHYRFGAGVCAFVPSIVNFKFTMEELLANYDMEMLFGLQCHDRGIRVVTPQRPYRYITFISDRDSTIDKCALHTHNADKRIIMTQKYLKSIYARNCSDKLKSINSISNKEQSSTSQFAMFMYH